MPADHQNPPEHPCQVTVDVISIMMTASHEGSISIPAGPRLLDGSFASLGSFALAGSDQFHLRELVPAQ